MEYCVIPRVTAEEVIDSMQSVVLDAVTPKNDVKWYTDSIKNIQSGIEFTVCDSLTNDDVWASEEIMSLNAELGLKFDMLVKFVHAVESTLKKKNVLKIPKELDVRNILLQVVPNSDGYATFVYAKSVSDVVSTLTKMDEQLENKDNEIQVLNDKLRYYT